MNRHALRPGRSVLTCTCFLAVLLAGPSGWAAAPTAPPSWLALPDGTVHWRLVGDRLYVATAAGHVQVWNAADRGALRRTSDRDMGGDILELRVVDGLVVVVVGRQEVQLLAVDERGQLLAHRARQPDGVASQAASTADAPRAEAPAAEVTATAVATAVPEPGRSARVGYVMASSRGRVAVNLTPGADVQAGQVLVIRSQALTQRTSLMTGRTEAAVSNEATGIVEVQVVEGVRAVADLGRGGTAQPGDVVERVGADQAAGPTFVPFSDSTMWARVMTRPMLNFGRIATGSLTELSGGTLIGPMHLQVRLAPVTLSAPYPSLMVNSQFLVSYATAPAEFGLGMGVMREVKSQWECGVQEQFDGRVFVPAQTTTERCTEVSGTVVQTLRLGAPDGLHGRAFSTLRVSGGSFVFGALEVTIDKPVTRVVNVYVSGGGGPGIGGWGDAGVRTYVRGVGGRETLVLTTGIGGSLLLTTSNEEAELGGLHLAIGLEWRL